MGAAAQRPIAPSTGGIAPVSRGSDSGAAIAAHRLDASATDRHSGAHSHTFFALLFVGNVIVLLKIS